MPYAGVMLSWSRYQCQCEGLVLLAFIIPRHGQKPQTNPLTNHQILRTQLAPTTYQLRKTKDLDFQFIDAPFAASPFPGIAEQYEGPFFGFSEQEPSFAQLASIARSTTRKDLSPEDHCREIRHQGLDRTSSVSCDFVSQLVQQHSERPFDGILGFSEGGSVAAS